MIFRNNTSIYYLSHYLYTADYNYISEHFKNSDTERIVRLDFAVCKFKLEAVNKKARFKVLKENLQIRRNIMKLSYVTSTELFI